MGERTKEEGGLNMVLDTGDKIAIATGVIGTLTGVIALIWQIKRETKQLDLEERRMGGAANPWFKGPSENVGMPQGGTDLGTTGVPDYSPLPFWKRTGRI